MQEDELRKVFDLYYLSITRYLNHLTGEVIVAQDLAQEVFLKLYCHVPADLANQRTWLFRTAANLGYIHLLRQQNQVYEETIASGSTDGSIIEDQEVKADERITVKEMLELLSQRECTCLIMKLSGFSYEEIGETIGVGKNAVAIILLQAMKNLRHQGHRNKPEKMVGCYEDHFLLAYLDGELKSEGMVVESHLRDCGQCRSAVKELADNEQYLEGMLAENLEEIELDSAFKEESWIRLKFELTPNKGEMANKIITPWMGTRQRRLIAALAIFLFIGTFFLGVATDALSIFREDRIDTIAISQEMTRSDEMIKKGSGK